MEHHESGGADEPPAIVDRTDAGGAWSRVWPLAALALVGLIAVRACVQPSATPPAPASTTPASR